MKRNDIIALALIAAGFALGAFYYADLPDPMPTHFGPGGKPDDFTALPWGAFIVPLISIGVWGLMRLLPAISPREFSMNRFRGAFDAVILSVVGFLTLVQFILLRTAINPGFDPSMWIQLLVGGILLIVANFMTKTRPNFFFGIRTPWTLASEEVWFRTHRQGAWFLAAIGVVAMVTAPFGAGLYLLIGLVVFSALWLVVYSYIAYVRLDNDSDDQKSTSTPTGQ